MSDLDAKLAEVARQYDDLQAELSRPETSTDPAAIRRLGQELSRLEPVVEAFRRLEATRAELAGARELRDSSDADDEMRTMARDEIERLEADEARLLEELKVLLLPRDPNDGRDVIMEIRGGAGGDEAALFAAELYRMYVRYAERHRFTPEILSLNETGIGGIKEAILQIHGDGAYSRLKFEGGVHRVQRIPATESSGRIHTSTVTVVVLPEVDEVEIEIDEVRDLRIDVKRASGTGRPVGQHHRLRGAGHPPADRARRRDPGREEPAQEQGQGDLGPALAAVRPPAAEAARGRFGGAAVDGRGGRPVGQGPDLQLPAGPGDRPPDRQDRSTTCPNVMDGDLDDLIDALVMADQADRLGDGRRRRLTCRIEGAASPSRRRARCCARGRSCSPRPDPRRARLDAELLLGDAVGAGRTAVVAHPEAPVGADAARRVPGRSRASRGRRAGRLPARASRSSTASRSRRTRGR